MKLNNFQKNFYIFSSIIISIFIGALLWEKIILPFNNTIGARGALVTEGYNPTNDVIKYIFLHEAKNSLTSVYLLLTINRSFQVIL